MLIATLFPCSTFDLSQSICYLLNPARARARWCDDLQSPFRVFFLFQTSAGRQLLDLSWLVVSTVCEPLNPPTFTERQLLDLPQQGMQPNRIEAYALLSMKDTGSISQLEVLHTGREPWFLAQVLVLNQTTGVQGLFVVNK